MLKKIFLGLGLITALSACSPSGTVVVTPPKPLTEASEVKTSWALNVPADWKKVEVRTDPTRLHDIQRVLVATKSFSLNDEEVKAVLTVTVGHVTQQESSEFVDIILSNEKAKEDSRVLESSPTMFGKTKGLELLELHKVDSHTFSAILMAVGSKNDLGVVAACGTQAEFANEILPECNKILDSLVIK
jgi:hypothetical protein